MYLISVDNWVITLQEQNHCRFISTHVRAKRIKDTSGNDSAMDRMLQKFSPAAFFFLENFLLK